MTKKQTHAKSNPLEGTCFVFTGEMQMDRDDARAKVIMLGGRVTAQPTGKTTHVVVGADPGSSKMQRIKELDVRILDEDAFKSLISEKMDGFEEPVIVNLSGSENVLRSEVWCEKWRPKDAVGFVGNQGVYTQLRDFLLGKTTFKAALLSGPPGIGKTTMAHVVAKELKLNVVEFNASDVRSKGELVERVKGGLAFQSIGVDLTIVNKVVIMDEIDGMTSDRGGVAELTKMMKSTKIPIVCICNDRYHPKIRTLAYYCLDLRFRKLEARQIIPRVKHILEKERKGVPDSVLNEVVQTAHGDMRYVLNTVQHLVSQKTLSFEQASRFVKKSATKNLFELGAEMFQRRKIAEKMDVYFEDYSFIPLMVQENYLNMNFKDAADTYRSAEAISIADLIDAHIHGHNQLWGLAPAHAFFSCIAPTRDHFLGSKVGFSTYLGQMSHAQKSKRCLGEINAHAFKVILASNIDTRMYYIELIFRYYVALLSQGRVDECIEILVEYGLLKDDVDSMAELLANGAQALKDVGAKAKSALSRTYNKLHRNLPYASPDKVKQEDAEEDEEL